MMPEDEGSQESQTGQVARLDNGQKLFEFGLVAGVMVGVSQIVRLSYCRAQSRG